MSERERDWLESLERAIEVTEGQIALAVAVRIQSISVQTDRAIVLIQGIRDLQRRVGYNEETIKRLESERR